MSPLDVAKFGVVVQDPVFISPAVQLMNESECNFCGVNYGPLVFQSGGDVEPHHFHKDGEGGVYFYRKAERRYKKIDGNCTLIVDSYGSDLVITGFIAVIEPYGEIYKDIANSHAERAERAKVQEIRAHCFLSREHSRERNGLFAEEFYSDSITRLYEGVLIAGQGSRLFPLCDLGNHPECLDRPKYSFRILEDGRFVFVEERR